MDLLAIAQKTLTHPAAPGFAFLLGAGMVRKSQAKQGESHRQNRAKVIESDGKTGPEVHDKTLEMC